MLQRFGMQIIILSLREVKKSAKKVVPAGNVAKSVKFF